MVKIESPRNPLVLIPVLDRPQNVQPLADSFERGESGGALMFLVNGSDTAEIAALKAAQTLYMVVPEDYATWPEKIEWAWLNLYLPEWVLLGADDLDFHPGWWEVTQPFRDANIFQVIGTNDLGNARVMSGEHTCHPLVHRDFVGLDGISPVHTGYFHWKVDDELVATAKAKGVWSFCTWSVIEHLHPYWGKSEWDATYALGESRAAEDILLWEKRSPMIEELCTTAS